MPPKKTNLKKARGASVPGPKGQKCVVDADDNFRSDDWETSWEKPVSLLFKYISIFPVYFFRFAREEKEKLEEANPRKHPPGLVQ